MVALLGVAAVAGVDWFGEWIRRRGRVDLAIRSRWLHRHARRMLAVLDIEVRTSGSPPTAGFLVSNHLSYLDILVLGAAAPCVFVAKREVKGWPVFGWLAMLAGTLFVDRTRRSDVGRVNDELRRAVGERTVLVLFPEGTSSDGRQVLPFKSSLLEVAAAGGPVTVAALGYDTPGADPGQVACYWGDMVFLPHLWTCLGQSRIAARVRFRQVSDPAADRKLLARQLHDEVRRLHTGEAAAT